MKNMGGIDRIVRAIVGIGLLILAFWVVTGALQIIFWIVAEALVYILGLYAMFLHEVLTKTVKLPAN